MNELWDGYREDGTLAGVTLVRGEPIPHGVYHLVSEILVRHTDGDYLLMQRSFEKPNYGGWYEATAGGSALQGEDGLTCALRELREETGISVQTPEHIGHYVSHNTIYEAYLCVTGQDKASVRLQNSETIAYRWITESEFIAFIHSGEMIDMQKKRYAPYFRNLRYMD